MARPKGIQGKPTILSKDEFSTVVGCSNDMSGVYARRNAALLYMLFGLGLRVSELCNLKVQDVWENNGVKKNTTVCSGVKTRQIPLSNEHVKNSIDEHMSAMIDKSSDIVLPNSPLFRTHKENHFSPNSLQQLLKRLFCEAGFHKASSETGRRTFAMHLLETKYSIEIIQKTLGHKSIVTTYKYLHEEPNPQEIPLGQFLKNHNFFDTD